MQKRPIMKESCADQSRIFNREVFFQLLDLEVERARRYQNFFCLLILTVKRLTGQMERGALRDFYQKLCGLLSDGLRESDILGALDKDKVVALLPYADLMAGDSVKTRFEENLRYFNYHEERFEVEVKRLCFPADGTGTGDLIQRLTGAHS
jgi:GGDEF domain-containing protein